MDGTLVDSAAVVPAAFVETVRRLGGSPVTPERVVELYRVGRPMEMLGIMLGRVGTQDDEDLYHRVLAESGDDVVVHDGVADALVALVDRGLRVAVFTGNSRPAAETILAATGLRDRFELVVGGDDVAHAKSAPDGVLEAASRLGSPLRRGARPRARRRRRPHPGRGRRAADVTGLRSGGHGSCRPDRGVAHG